jgi:alkanesulfonate monooxygenase SsuD/methylene tetrahydromethanopterin reductase-like flavin-dependent oxidoreductase (luciferase family)
MTGPRTIETHTVPTIGAAAAKAGRPAPRIAVGLPVCVTDDLAVARQRAAQTFAVYGELPSYRAMLDREGAAGPADVAVMGDETALAGALEHLAAIGTTDFIAVIFGSTEERERANAALRALVGRV